MSDSHAAPPRPLTVEHLGYLWEKGILTSALAHLGPMPITRVTMPAEDAKRDLIAHGFLTSSDLLTSLGEQIISALMAPDESWWGIILLRSQATTGPIEVPDEWRRYGLESSVMTIPRVYFTLAYSGGLCAVAVRSGNNVSLASVKSVAPRDSQAAEILMEILNPRQEWKPAADFEELVIPHDVTAQMGKVGPTGNELLDSQVRIRRRRAYSERGMSDEDVSRTLDFLENTAQVAASMQVQHMDSMGRTTPSAISVELLYNVGMVVVFPFAGFDRQWWLRICKANMKNMLAAVRTVRELEHFAFEITENEDPTTAGR
ncbi:hypothetical protein [Gordonia sihwensis]|uniref:hypothetical protein n=1 Tax=Gordonia sihwensis TaxID=173559 RepID=UPI003D97776B